MQLNIVSPRLKYLLIMKLLIFFTLVFTLQVSAKSFGQKVTLSANNSPLEKLFKEVKKQTGYTFVYTRQQLKNSLPVTIQVTNTLLKDFLSICFKNQPLTFIIEDNYVVIQSKTTAEKLVVIADTLIDIKGKVVNENGEPLIGATVLATQTNKVALTNAQGEFSLTQINQNELITISNVGYVSEKLNVNNQRYYLIKLKFAINSLDETIVKGYYSTSKKLNTGSVVKVSGEQITNQPITNPILGLEGLVPGLLITQSNGLPGSRFTALIRGKNSIQNGNSPLFIIDGVPFLSDRDALTQLNGMLANSPFNSLDPNNIESIEVLKDADATAIYGSRGANGVILITTKKINTEKNSLSLNLSSSWGKVTKTMKFMNTSEYLQMRKEAFVNDGITPSIYDAPDLVAWDQDRYTDWKKEFIGGVAKNYKANLRYTGGNNETNFSFGTGYNKETTVFPGSFREEKLNTDLTVNHQSKNNKFKLNLITGYTLNNSLLPAQDLTAFINLPPNNYGLKDSAGNYLWSEADFSYGNPLAILEQRNNVITDRLTVNSLLSYKPLAALELKINLGYNKVGVDEKITSPIISQDPSYSPTGSSAFGNNFIKTWLFEPQISFNKTLISQLQIDALAGNTLQKTSSEKQLIIGSGYTNDQQLNSIAAAPFIKATNTKTQYHYAAFFGRVGLNWSNKYILNLTGRRDGSSRFGMENRFSNFGSIGAAWVFSKETIIQKFVPALSYGKLRASYGTTGNDQIGNYQYLDTYKGTIYAYDGQPGLTPSRLFNSNYSWEENKKFEIATELGFLQNKILINFNYYKNESSNQIIRYSLPTQTGFTNVLLNFPGKVQNKGYEISANANIIKTKNFQWNINFNISHNKNILVSFPGLKNSSYASTYLIGKPLNANLGLHFIGVDTQTGIYKFEDINKDGSIDIADYTYIGTTDPKYYGGFKNTITFKGLEINILLEFRKHLGFEPIYFSQTALGSFVNQPVQAQHHWQKEGDNTPYQKYTQDFSNPAFYPATFDISSSDAALTDASFIRLKNIALAYSLFNPKQKKLKGIEWKIYLQLQNILTITNFQGNDPENQSISSLPPLKIINIGTQINF